MHSMRLVMGTATSPPELHMEQELQQSCTACGRAMDSKGVKHLLFALLCCLSCPAASHLFPPAGWQLINPSKIIS